jgi:hypothetical protein
MATKKRATRTAPKPAIDPIFLSIWERIEIHTNLLTSGGSYDEVILTLEIRDRLKPQPDEIESMNMQEVGPGAWMWNSAKESGKQRAFRFNQAELSHIRKAYDLRAAKKQIDQRPPAMDLMFKFISRDAFVKKAKAKKADA